MRKLFLFTLLLSYCAAAQQKDALRYREDQFYVDLNLAVQANDISDFQQKGFFSQYSYGIFTRLSIDTKRE